MNAAKIIGLADEGKCECCGANCPKRRVLVATESGEQAWGVVCASKARGERGNATDAKHLSKFAEFVGSVRQAVLSGADARKVRNTYGFPMDFRPTEIRIGPDTTTVRPTR